MAGVIGGQGIEVILLVVFGQSTCASHRESLLQIFPLIKRAAMSEVRADYQKAELICRSIEA